MKGKHYDKNATGSHGYGAKASPSKNMSTAKGPSKESGERNDVAVTPSSKNPYPEGLS